MTDAADLAVPHPRAPDGVRPRALTEIVAALNMVADYGAVPDGVEARLAEPAEAGARRLILSADALLGTPDDLRPGVAVHGEAVAPGTSVSAVTHEQGHLVVELDAALPSAYASDAPVWFGTDNYDAFRAAQDAIQATPPGEGPVRVTPGTYYLSQHVFVSSGTHWIVDGGVRTLRSGLDGVTDDTFLVGNTLALKSEERGLNSSPLFISGLFAPTGGETPDDSYQKNGLYVRVMSYDPSTYITNPLGTDDSAFAGDSVGIEVQSIIAPGNTMGRAWGYHCIVACDDTADGSMWLAEYEMMNGAPYNPEGLKQSRYTKMGLHLDLSGNDAHYAIALGGDAAWFSFLSLSQGNIRTDGYLFQYWTQDGADRVFAVDHGGHLRAASLELGSTVSTIPLRDRIEEGQAEAVPISRADGGGPGLTDGTHGTWTLEGSVAWHDADGNVTEQAFRALCDIDEDAGNDTGRVGSVLACRVEDPLTGRRSGTYDGGGCVTVGLLDRRPVLRLETGGRAVRVVGLVTVTRLG